MYSPVSFVHDQTVACSAVVHTLPTARAGLHLFQLESGLCMTPGPRTKVPSALFTSAPFPPASQSSFLDYDSCMSRTLLCPVGNCTGETPGTVQASRGNPVHAHQVLGGPDVCLGDYAVSCCIVWARRAILVGAGVAALLSLATGALSDFMLCIHPGAGGTSQFSGDNTKQQYHYLLHLLIQRLARLGAPTGHISTVQILPKSAYDPWQPDKRQSINKRNGSKRIRPPPGEGSREIWQDAVR